ncbi:MAG: response regulator transcription factor [Anaerolineales bacterium]|nr:response regulator transcription factor [Anaerolineales bacterium]
MSVRSELKDKLAAYDAGADDYLVKPFDMRELGARLQAVLRRSARQAEAERLRAARAEPETPTPPVEAPVASGVHVLTLGSLHLYVDAALVETSHSTARLTPAEMDLLKYLMAHPDQILASERLLQEVWLYPPGTGDPAVVRWHVKNLRRKIELNPETPVYLRTISHHGYMLVSDSASSR